MVINRNTKQRSVILEEISNTDTHPTALQIFEMAKRRLPDIGLATVYRCLDLLQKQGQVIKLRSKSQGTRYDGKVEGHAHLICTKCGYVQDVFDINNISLNSKELKNSGFHAFYNYLEIPGLCKQCK